MTEAIVAFTSKSFVARGLGYNERLTLHWVLQIVAGTLIGVAFWAIYMHKTNNNYDHFSSPHASMGLTTILMIIGTTSGGIAARYSATFRKAIKPAYLKIVHSTFGVITYALAIYTFCLGLDTVWFRTQCNSQLIKILTYSVIALALLAVTKPIISIAKKFRNSTKSH